MDSTTACSTVDSSVTATVVDTNAMTDSSAMKPKLGFLDRFLAVFVFLAMVSGVLIGYFVPDAQVVLEKGEFAGVSGPVGMTSSYLVVSCCSSIVKASLLQLLSCSS